MELPAEMFEKYLGAIVDLENWKRGERAETRQDRVFSERLERILK
jgi:hypothetical protein